MGAATIAIIAIFILVCTYLYVMGLCYLCDRYEQRKNARREEEEKKRKQELQRAIEETELRRKTELERRKRAIEERRQRARPQAKAV
jgi:hypothetical protein